MQSLFPSARTTRMSGVNLDGRAIRKGATRRDCEVSRRAGQRASAEVRDAVEAISRTGGTPLVVAENGRALGVIHLKDIVKGGMRQRFDQLRAMGIKTVMITGDNPLTAAAIASEAGVDDFLAQATPKDKLDLIRREQGQGKLVAMTGDGTNDAPALAQADVGVAMNTGTQAAKEAGNMVDLDSNPTKLIEIVEIGKQLLMTRGALTTFSIANDVAKYFAIIPAMFAGTFPVLQALNVMRLATPQSAILSAVIFNALIIVALIPLALRGREICSSGSSGAVAAKSAGLWAGRSDCAVYRNQADRPADCASGIGVETTMKKNLITAVLMTVVTTVLFGLLFPLLITGLAQVLFPKQGERRTAYAEWQGRGIAIDRTVVFFAGIFSLAAFERGNGLRCGQLQRIESWADESNANCASAGRCGPTAGRESRRADPNGFADDFGFGAGSSHFAGGGGISGATDRERARAERGCSSRSGAPAYGVATIRISGRTAGECAGTESYVG